MFSIKLSSDVILDEYVQCLPAGTEALFAVMLSSPLIQRRLTSSHLGLYALRTIRHSSCRPAILPIPEFKPNSDYVFLQRQTAERLRKLILSPCLQTNQTLALSKACPLGLD